MGKYRLIDEYGQVVGVIQADGLDDAEMQAATIPSPPPPAPVEPVGRLLGDGRRLEAWSG